MTETKQDNIIFIKGKAKALQKIFSQEQGCFGYVALGYNTENDGNGFINVDDDTNSQNGFHEITQEEDSTYRRAKLSLYGDPVPNESNGEVTVKFTAEFDVDNITSGITIDQIAIVDSEDVNNIATNYYAAAVCDTSLNKSDQLALVFIIEITL